MEVYLSPQFRNKADNLSINEKRRLDSWISKLSNMKLSEVLNSISTNRVSNQDDLISMNFMNLRIYASIERVFENEALVLLDLQQKSMIDHRLDISSSDLKWDVDAIVADTNYKLIEDDEINAVMSETNTYGWYVDEYSIEEVSEKDGYLEAHLEFSVIGEQDPDLANYGVSATGTAIVRIWNNQHVEYEVCSIRLKPLSDL